MLHLIQLKARVLKYKRNCLDVNTFLGLLQIHLTPEINKSILCLVTIWGQLTSNTFLIKGSCVPIYPFNFNYPESENHTKQKRHSKKYFEIHGIKMKIGNFHSFMHISISNRSLSLRIGEDI